jgi:hypothetical protein
MLLKMLPHTVHQGSHHRSVLCGVLTGCGGLPSFRLAFQHLAGLPPTDYRLLLPLIFAAGTPMSHKCWSLVSATRAWRGRFLGLPNF